MPIALATGARREVTRQLAERDYTLFLIARDEPEARAAADEVDGVVVWLATLPDDGPTGGLFRDGRPVAF